MKKKLRNTAFTLSGFFSKQQRLSADDLPRASSTKPMKDLLHCLVSCLTLKTQKGSGKPEGNTGKKHFAV